MYLTVLNKFSKKDIPFLIMPNGEIKINSTNSADDEDTCYVTLSKVFYNNSIDFGRVCKKV